MIGQLAQRNFEQLKEPQNVLVAGEYQDLMPGGSEVAQHGGGGLRPRGIEVHQHVVEHQRQWRPMPAVGGRQRKPQA